MSTQLRTNAQKAATVRRLLADPAWCWRSDRMIAEAAGVSHSMVSKCRRPLPRAGADEHAMERGFVASLRARGIRCSRQLRCGVGIADVVDDEWCYELKLAGEDLFKAVGQALMYAKCLGRKACVVLGSPARPSHAEVAESMGVRVVVLRDAIAIAFEEQGEEGGPGYVQANGVVVLNTSARVVAHVMRTGNVEAAKVVACSLVARDLVFRGGPRAVVFDEVFGGLLLRLMSAEAAP